MEREQQKLIIEALLFLTEEAVTIKRISLVLSVAPEETESLVLELKEDLSAAGRGIQIFETAGGYQMGTLPELAPYLEKAFSEDVSSNLSTAALETLAIIAYKQPVTRIEVESIRGVRCEHVLENLVKRKLIKISGRKEGPGRPRIYSTTADFLKYFGLKDLSELPELDLEKENNIKDDQEQVDLNFDGQNEV
ncbi:MAG: SMC-Scp complex subunit ScpB [Bacillota bacterium]